MWPLAGRQSVPCHDSCVTSDRPTPSDLKVTETDASRSKQEQSLWQGPLIMRDGGDEFHLTFELLHFLLLDGAACIFIQLPS